MNRPPAPFSRAESNPVPPPDLTSEQSPRGTCRQRSLTLAALGSHLGSHKKILCEPQPGSIKLECLGVSWGIRVTKVFPGDSELQLQSRGSELESVQTLSLFSSPRWQLISRLGLKGPAAVISMLGTPLPVVLTVQVSGAPSGASGLVPRSQTCRDWSWTSLIGFPGGASG